MQIRPWHAGDDWAELTALLHAAYASLTDQGWNFTAATQSVDMTRQRLSGAQAWVAVDESGRLRGTVSASGPKGDTYVTDEAPALYRRAQRGYAAVGHVQRQGKTYASVLMCKRLRPMALEEGAT